MLTGIILTGGNSSRMGTDKSQLKLGDNTLAEIAFEKLKPVCNAVCYSINKNQQDLPYRNTVLDFYENPGPLSGIISSFMFVETSILILAVDMPNISSATIRQLIENRNPKKLVTAFFDEEKQRWEGMLSIWEYHSFPIVQDFFDKGGRSLQKFLFSNDVEKIRITNPDEFRNINTMKEFEDLR